MSFLFFFGWGGGGEVVRALALCRQRVRPSISKPTVVFYLQSVKNGLRYYVSPPKLHSSYSDPCHQTGAPESKNPKRAEKSQVEVLQGLLEPLVPRRFLEFRVQC